MNETAKEFYMLMGEVALMREQLEAMQSRMAMFWDTTLRGYNEGVRELSQPLDVRTDGTGDVASDTCSKDENQS